jgi:dCTP deaminase
VTEELWDDWLPGVLSRRQVQELVDHEFIRNASTNPKDFDHSSFDLRIDDEAYELNACVKPFGRAFRRHLLKQKLAKRLPPQTDGTYILKSRHSYLFKIMERIPDFDKTTPIYGSATAKSSVGRMDVLARLIVDGMDEYEGFVPHKVRGGDMFLEITPMTFNVRVKAGTPLTQLRLFKGPQRDSLIQGDTLLATVFQDYEENAAATLSVDLSPDQVCGRDVSAFSAALQREPALTAIDLWTKEERDKPKPWEYWRFERTDENQRLRITTNHFYIIRSREKIHLPKGIAVYCRASDETIGEMRIHYAGFVHPFFGSKRSDGKRGTPLIFEVRGHDIDVSLMDREKMARLEFYRMSEDAEEPQEDNKAKEMSPDRPEAGAPEEISYRRSYEMQKLQLSSFFAKWPDKANVDSQGTVTPK